MAAPCPVCKLKGKQVYFQECLECKAIFCPVCGGQMEPYMCPRCDSQKLRVYPGTYEDLKKLM